MLSVLSSLYSDHDIHTLPGNCRRSMNTCDLMCLAKTKRFEPRCEKTGLRGFRPGPTQTRL